MVFIFRWMFPIKLIRVQITWFERNKNSFSFVKFDQISLKDLSNSPMPVYFLPYYIICDWTDEKYVHD
jgi:hypothetical protein